MSHQVVTEIEVVVKMPSLNSDAVVRAMDDCSDIAESADDVLQWTIGSDLGDSTITFDFLLDLADVAAAEARGQELTQMVLNAGTVTARSGAIVAA
jgi:hypothetical protein